MKDRLNRLSYSEVVSVHQKTKAQILMVFDYSQMAYDTHPLSSIQIRNARFELDYQGTLALV